MASVQKRPNGQWRARYRDADGKWRARHFDRKVDAGRFLDKVRGDLARGEWVDPQLARTPFGEYAKAWQAAQVQHRPTTAEQLERQLRVHILPTFERRQIGSIRRSDVQGWIAGRAEVLAPATVQNCYTWLATIMRSAVKDRLIPASPCVDINLPRIERDHVRPLTTDQVLALVDAAPDRYRALVVLAAGSGLREGELLALDVARIDWLGRTVRVDRQLVTMAHGAPVFSPPKTRASRRTVPLAGQVVEEVAEHVRQFQPGGGLLFTNDRGAPIRRHRINETWRATADRAEVEAKFHDLRHYFASLLIAQGASVKAVQAALGHASASETLNTYSHLWPDDNDRIRLAVSRELGKRLVS
jgi:integrase